MNAIQKLYLIATFMVAVTASVSALPVSLNYQNGLTYGWTSHNDTTGLGVRSNWLFSCVQYIGNGQYFMTNSFVC